MTAPKKVMMNNPNAATDLKKCYMTELASGDLWMKYAKKTAQFGSSREGTPWIVVDGTHIDTSPRGQTVIEEVCDAYTGTKPAACNSAAQIS